MSSSRACLNCGAQLRASAKYCDECGAPVQGEPASQPVGKMTKQEVEIILRMREQKDNLFRYHLQSPIPQDAKEAFEGLKYHPVNPSYRFLCKLNRYPNPTTIGMMTSTGQERNYLKVGYVRFTIGGKSQTLQAFKAIQSFQQEGEKEPLFIPFRDATSGKESYAAARYLDSEELKDGVFLVDFNSAYNPYCAYSDEYSCPFPPQDNWLEVEIRAGEKKFKDQKQEATS